LDEALAGRKNFAGKALFLAKERPCARVIYMRILATAFFLVTMLSTCKPDSARQDQTSNPTIPLLTRGEPLDFKGHLVSGKVTLFDLYAPWCAPCTRLEKTLHGMQAFYGQKLAIFRADIVSFDSPLARQQQVQDLPYLVAFDETGQLLARGPSAEVLPRLLEHLNP
jgi:thiol-disulfide isomerase/thioredoxin